MKPTPYTPGMRLDFPMLVTGMPDTVYHSTTHEGQPIASKSGLDKLNRSPAHYRFAPAREPSRAMIIGSAIHAALLTPDQFASDYLLLRDAPDRRCSEYKAACKAWHKGEDYVLVGHEADHVAGMQESVFSNRHARAGLLMSGYREASLFVRDPVTSVPVRVRFDVLSTDGVIIDIKKTRDARPSQFQRSINEYRYHVQAALYSDAFEWAFGDFPKGFAFLAIEDTVPYACKVYRPDTAAMQEGRRAYREDLDRFADCVRTGDWPAYDSTPEYIGLPPWVMSQIEDEAASDDTIGE